MDEFFKIDPKAAGSKGIVYIGSKMLVYRRDENTDVFPLYIDLPGGISEPNETPFETFRREVKEEFGLVVMLRDVTYVRSYPSNRHGGKTLYFPVVQLPGKAANQIEFGDEGLEYFLMKPKEFLRRDDVWPEYRERSIDYFNSLDR